MEEYNEKLEHFKLKEGDHPSHEEERYHIYKPSYNSIMVGKVYLREYFHYPLEALLCLQICLGRWCYFLSLEYCDDKYLNEVHVSFKVDWNLYLHLPCLIDSIYLSYYKSMLLALA